MSKTTSLKRVVVTGLGAVTPLGNTVTETWDAAINGVSGVGKISLFDPEGCSVHIAAEVKNFDPVRSIDPLEFGNGTTLTHVLHPKEEKKVGRFAQLALSAGVDAYLDSGLHAHRSKINSERIGVNIGVGMGGLPEIEKVHKDLLEKGYRRVTPFLIPQIIPNIASGRLSMSLDFKGPNLCNITACSSSAHSIGESYWLIQRGVADVVLAGGAESVISPVGIGGFAAMKALSTRNDEPQKASRPFDQGRNGFVMGEGAACLMLEEYEHAVRRGAQIYAELTGYGLSGDAYHVTLPAPEGEGGRRAMQMALDHAGIEKEKIHYINAHGTSTPAGDAEEARAVAHLFPNAKEHLHVSSTKSMTGHLLGAAGSLEALFSVLAIQKGIIPPTINLEQIDPNCEQTSLNFTPLKAVKKEIHAALSNSFGFGGTNASLIFEKVHS